MPVYLGKLPYEGPPSTLGPGLSRARPNEATRRYRLTVQRPGQPVIRILIPAPSQRKAVQYCKNRWPDAVVTPIK